MRYRQRFGVVWTMIGWLCGGAAVAATPAPAVTAAPMSAPTVSSVFADGPDVVVGWYGTKGAAGYEVLRAADPQQAATTVAKLSNTSLGYRDKKANTGPHYYQIVAVGAHGSRLASKWIPFRPPPGAPVPGSPTVAAIPGPPAPAPLAPQITGIPALPAMAGAVAGAPTASSSSAPGQMMRPPAPVANTCPPSVNPAGFSAVDQGQGVVQLQWQAPPGATSYQINGTATPSNGNNVTSVGVTLQNVPAGPGSWQLVAIYPHGCADYAHPALASTVVHVLPPHPIPWLTMNNGAGGAAQTIAHYGPLQLDPQAPVGTTAFATLQNTSDLNAFVNVSGFDDWTDDSYDSLNGFIEWDKEAVYGNTVDLGVGRRTRCFQQLQVGLSGITPVSGLRTVCYATAHGLPPGRPGFVGQDTTHPSPGDGGGDFILAMMIIKDLSGAHFYVLKSHSYNDAYKHHPVAVPQFKATLDSEGGKFIPHVCLSCHGGTYNPTTHVVDGASFLPLNPSLLAFASAGDLALQQWNIARVNEIIMNADPKSAVADFIRGLYPGNIDSPQVVATPDFVPIGWSQQAGLYRQIVGPYCANCHMAAPSAYNFMSYDNFMANKAAIFLAVCKAHTMPHAEIPFKALWTSDTGSLYLPGLLATVLGYPSCS
jgi:hypothetical protein